MKKSFLSAVLLAITCAFSSCAKDVDSIIGKWQLQTVKVQLIKDGQVIESDEEHFTADATMYWHFMDESSGKYIEYYDGIEEAMEFTYTLNKNVLVITDIITGHVATLTNTKLSVVCIPTTPEGDDMYYETSYNFVRVIE